MGSCYKFLLFVVAALTIFLSIDGVNGLLCWHCGDPTIHPNCKPGDTGTSKACNSPLLPFHRYVCLSMTVNGKPVRKCGVHKNTNLGTKICTALDGCCLTDNCNGPAAPTPEQPMPEEPMPTPDPKNNESEIYSGKNPNSTSAAVGGQTDGYFRGWILVHISIVSLIAFVATPFVSFIGVQ